MIMGIAEAVKGDSTEQAAKAHNSSDIKRRT
jgi:hypothetical protein